MKNVTWFTGLIFLSISKSYLISVITYSTTEYLAYFRLSNVFLGLYVFFVFSVHWLALLGMILRLKDGTKTYFIDFYWWNVRSLQMLFALYLQSMERLWMSLFPEIEGRAVDGREITV